MKTKSLFTLCFIILHSAFCLSARAQSTAFTYQGRLFSGTNAASGNYDLAFSLFDAGSGGTLLATPITNSVSGVSNGLFTVTLDFGASVFPGADRWLEISTRTNGAVAFTTLTPRQKITSAPYAVRAVNASTAASAVSLSGTLPATQLTGTVPLAQLPGAVVTNNASGVVLNGTFIGNGAGVTNVQLTTLSTYGAVTWPGNFAPGSTLPVGLTPHSAIAADVNGDGWPDLISANTSSNSLTVFTNNRSGGFGSNATCTLSAGPWMVAAADVNGDGKLDLLSVNSSTVIVLTNNGAGGFGSNATLSVGTLARSLAVADINRDGWPDFIIANSVSTTLRVFTNNGTGVFGSNAVLTVGSQPFVIATDVNGDGWPDLVTANNAGNSVSILLNSGGTFGAATTVPVSGGPTLYSPVGIAAGDLNGDGKPDLITANSADNSLSLLLNNGSGSFTVVGTVTAGLAPRSVVARDVNGDGKVDLISANSGTNTLTVLTNDGSGGFALAGTAGVGSQPWSLTAADVNGDGRPDLISANSGDNTLTVLLNTPAFSGNGAGLTSLNPGSLTSGTVTSALTFSNAANSFTGNGGSLTNLQTASLITRFSTLVGWGDNSFGQTNIPVGLNYVAAVAVGRSHCLALKNDGTVLAWGDNSYGQLNVPVGLNNVKSVSAGAWHCLAVKNDGTVVAWGYNGHGQTNVPPGLSSVAAVAAGWGFSMALLSNGTVVAWGNNSFGETNVPAGLHDAMAVAAGDLNGLTIRSNGTVVAWGDNSGGQTNVPAGLNNVVAVAAGSSHFLALKRDGTVMPWGDNTAGQTNIPAGLSNVVAVAAGSYHSLALRSDGTLVAWGDNSAGQTNVPAGLSNVAAVAAGGFCSLALRTGNESAQVALLDQPNTFTGGNLFSGANVLNNPGNSFTGNGAGLTSLNASNLASGTVPAAALGNAWQTAGNAGANPASGAFLGTTDNLPLELKVNGARGLRIEPTGGGPNMIGGSPFNTVSAGVGGATIGGGGHVGHGNSVTANYGTVGGGEQNTSADHATVGGGNQNTASGSYATVPGGLHNTAQGEYSFAAGQSAKANHQGAFVWADSQFGDFASTANDQFLIRAQGGVWLGPDTTSIGTMGNQPLELNVNGTRALRIEPNSTSPNMIGGYSGNVVSNGVHGATIGGGGESVYENRVGGNDGTVGGGIWNVASGSASTVSGGFYNTAAGGAATVSGGDENEATGSGSMVPGGFSNHAKGKSSLAAGDNAFADHDGSFVWADTSTYLGGFIPQYHSTGANQFDVRATGGFQFVTALDSSGNPSIGVTLAGSGASWGTISDRNAKKNFQPVDARAILEKLVQMPVQRWNYKSETDNYSPHLGPMAQDFKGAFFPGRDDKVITTLEFDGVELAAIQGLNEKVEIGKQKAETQIQELKTENEELKARLEKLERLMNQNNGGRQ